ncbi:hypothetical protein P8452_18475 [Trifolium repens]|nr:hypothetical protein P8452_18475 [Trifolium repens]
MEVCSLQGCSPAGESSCKFARGEGSSRDCQWCIVLSIKIKILEAKLEVAQSPKRSMLTHHLPFYTMLWKRCLARWRDYRWIINQIFLNVFVSR